MTTTGRLAGPDVPALSPWKRFLFAAISMALGFAFSFLVCELVLRAYERRLKQEERAPQETLHILGPNPAGTGSFRLLPNLSLVTRVERYDVSIQTNRHGMRWRDVSVEKPPGKKRVAVLGDSHTFGCWADSIDRSFVGVFERGISQERFEVLNFGVGGYGIDDQELLLAEQVMRFSPDFVVIVFFDGNDFRDTYLGINKYKIVDGTAVMDTDVMERKIPAEYLRAPFLTSKPIPETSLVKIQLQRLATYRLLSPLLELDNPFLEFRVSQRFISLTFWSQFPYPEVARRARDETLATFKRIQAFLAPKGVRLAIAAMPTRDQVYSRDLAGPDFDIGFPQDYVKIFARENGIPYLDLLPALRARVQDDHARLFIHRDTHLNNAGHEVAGQALAEWFRSSVKLSPLPRAAAGG